MARRRTPKPRPKLKLPPGKIRVAPEPDLAALAWTRAALAAVPALVEKYSLADLLVPETSRELAAAAFNVADAFVSEAAYRFRTADAAPA